MTITPRHDPYAALRVPAYRFYASAWVIAIFGSQIQSVALGWDLYSRTGDALILGFVGLLQALPLMVLAIPAGQMADRFDRRKLLMYSQMASVLTSIGLVTCSVTNASANVYLAILFFDAIANAIGWPARASLLPLLVPRAVFPNAVTWNTSLGQFARIAAPALGGFIAVYTLTGAYVCDLIGGIWFVICMAMLKTMPQQKSGEAVSLKTLLAGLRFVMEKKIILATISLDLFAVLLGGAVYLLPVVAKDVLNSGPTALGYLRAAPAVGALATALLLAYRPPMKRAGLNMLWAVAGFGAATIVFGLSRNFYLSVAALMVTGALDNISVVVRHTLMQTLTPDEMRGRVSAVNAVFIGASNELGGFESGLTARLFGVTASIVGGGIGTILVVLGVNRLFPQVRAFGALVETKPFSADPPSPTPEQAGQPAGPL